jgi:starvation-inducible DNA-binding protein
MPEVHEAERQITETNSPEHPVVRDLQCQLANALLAFINYKHYHWQVSGPWFRDLHLMFDEFAKEAAEALDEVAERLRMIGQDPVFRLDEVARQASIRPAEIRDDLRAMIQEADENAILLISEVRQAARTADDADDPGTVDLLGKIVRVYEKQEWYLREVLKSPGGLLGNYRMAG